MNATIQTRKHKVITANGIEGCGARVICRTSGDAFGRKTGTIECLGCGWTETRYATMHHAETPQGDFCGGELLYVVAEDEDRADVLCTGCFEGYVVIAWEHLDDEA